MIAGDRSEYLNRTYPKELNTMTSMSRSNRLQAALERLYEVFAPYQISDIANVGCFDFGPTSSEAAALSGDVREIPDDVVVRMEFFGKGWSSWGTREEVKHLLPRLMEYLADDVGRLGDPGFLSLFSYKLTGCLSTGNRDWSAVEQESIKEFLLALLESDAAEPGDLGNLLEVMLELGLDTKSLIGVWSGSKSLDRSQLESVFTHFGYRSGKSPTTVDLERWLEVAQIEHTFPIEQKRLMNLLLGMLTAFRSASTGSSA